MNTFYGGLVLGIIVLGLFVLLRRWQIKVSWYEWLLGIIGLALMLFSYQNYYTSRAEFEPVAPGRFLLIFGLPGLVLLVIAVLLVGWDYMRKKKLGSPAAAELSDS